MRKLPTGSNLPRVFPCVGSEALPHFQSTTEPAVRGKMVHDFIEHARKVGREAALDALPEEYEGYDFCAAVPLHMLPTGGSHEVALAWDYVTDAARILPGKGHRDYSAASATEYCLTVDYMGRDGGALVILDYKTGHKYLGPAKDSRQLRLGSLAGARLEGVTEVRAGYCFLREDGSFAYSWATFDAFDLAEIADEMRELVSAIEAAQAAAEARKPLPLHEGDWCDYCPAFNSCPAKMALALVIGTGEALDELAEIERTIATATEAQLAAVCRRLEQLEPVIERVRKSVRASAAMQPIDLGDGRRLGSIPWPFTSVKPDVAYATVLELHGQAAAEKACPRKATLGAIKELGDDTLAEIERRRGVVTGSKPQVRVHRP